MTAEGRSVAGRHHLDSAAGSRACVGSVQDDAGGRSLRSALIVEDDEHAAKMLVRLFRRLGWQAEVASDGRAGLDRAVAEPPHLVILDLGLPLLTGVKVCRGIRAAGLDVPIIVLTASDAVEDLLAAFDAGADDCLTKPVNTLELAARIEARTRVIVKVHVAGNVRLDLIRKRAFCLDRDMNLTRIEFDLLYFLASQLGRPVSMNVLAREVWDHGTPLKTDTYRVTISNLRRKLRAHSASLNIPVGQSNEYVLRLAE